MLFLLKLYFFLLQLRALPSFLVRHFICSAFSCPAFSCLAISCPANWSVIFMSVIFSQPLYGTAVFKSGSNIAGCAHLGPARDCDPHYQPLDHLTWHDVRLGHDKLVERLMARITSRYNRATDNTLADHVERVSLNHTGCAGHSKTPSPIETYEL